MNYLDNFCLNFNFYRTYNFTSVIKDFPTIIFCLYEVIQSPFFFILSHFFTYKIHELFHLNLVYFYEFLSFIANAIMNDLAIFSNIFILFFTILITDFGLFIFLFYFSFKMNASLHLMDR
jgi:hypothetical protein